MNKNKNWFLQEAVPLREKGMSYGAIANALGMANTTVKSAFQRAGYKGAQYISDYIQIADKPTEKQYRKYISYVAKEWCNHRANIKKKQNYLNWR